MFIEQHEQFFCEYLNQPYQIKIAIIGLGYVGLPLAVEFAKKYNVVGFDINKKRILELISGRDHTLEVDDAALKNAIKEDQAKNIGLTFSHQLVSISDCNFFLVTVPTS